MPVTTLLFWNYSHKIGDLLFSRLCQHNRRRLTGELQRNRAHLRVQTDPQLPVDIPTTESELPQPPTSYSGSVTRSQTGTVLHPPEHLRY